MYESSLKFRQENGGAKNDIALIKLEKPVRFSRFIQPICLPTRPRQFEEECCHVAGWGKTKFRWNYQSYVYNDVVQSFTA